MRENMRRQGLVYIKIVEKTRKKSIKYNELSLKGDYKVTYKFNENVSHLNSLPINSLYSERSFS